MKNLISSSLFAMAVFLHFRESHSSGFYQAGPSEPPGPDPYVPEPAPIKESNSKSKRPNRVFSFANDVFGAWNHPGGRPREVRLISAENIVPDEEFRKKHVVEDRYVEKDGIRFVMYVQDGVVLGAQFAPERPAPTGPKRNLAHSNHPTRTFSYKNRQIGVWEDAAGIPRAVGLVNGNVVPSDSDHRKYLIRTQMVHQDGVFFLVHTVLPSENILGVEIAPGWNPPY